MMRPLAFRPALVLLALAGGLLAGRPAQAQELQPGSYSSSSTGAAGGVGPTGFGGVGQVAISSDFEITFTHKLDAETSHFALDPAIDYFLAPHISGGGQFVFEYDKTPGGHSTGIGLRPRVGYDYPLADMFSVYAKAGLSLVHVSETIDAGPVSASADATLFSLFIDVPFLFHPVPHFFIGIGPSLVIDLTGGSRRDTEIGLHTTVGGWFDW